MKHTLFLIAVVAFFASGCISSKNDPKPGDGASTSDSYFPVTSGSTWTYKEEIAGATSSTVIKMTGNTKTFNGKSYYEATSSSTVKGNTLGYFYTANHDFSILQTIPTYGINIEIHLGNDTKAAGYSWTTSPTADGYVNGFPAQMINTIKEKGITRVVNGKTFTNVMHTQADLQYDLGSGFMSYSVYDFYLAKGVGMIESDTGISGSIYDKETILSYNVK
ncbi:hypothetical protein [Mucilaginibacter flavidus]|uniref:hypothetical protein n=1 Tax=Mucilaginibacter flavidus TaxID=2949309 RepID=UPI0020933DCF|nr:hypothetical protein [Mucilaginibacter flavidus]MCO5950658.1 hypothetical protein [Mucilaginibacter flavidus]